MLTGCSRLINAFRRIKALLEGNKEKHEVIAGGTTNDEESFIPPTIVAGVKSSDPVMQDEASVLFTVHKQLTKC